MEKGHEKKISLTCLIKYLGKSRLLIRYLEMACVAFGSDIKDAINARKEAEENLYGEFENWYSKEYPEKYKKLKNRG